MAMKGEWLKIKSEFANDCEKKNKIDTGNCSLEVE